MDRVHRLPPWPGGVRACLRWLVRVVTTFALVLTAIAWEPALSQVNGHRNFLATGRADAADGLFQTPPPTRMVPLQAAMTQAYPTIGANADGSDVWPCYGRSAGNPDCPTIGNPPVPFPRGAFATGVPAFSWALRNDDILGFGLGNGTGCDALINGTTGLAASQYKPCGQITTFFEDDTNDANDDLLQRIVVTQGLKILFDSGIVDFGPAGPSVKYPVDVELSYDANFGYWPGARHGPNNGNCVVDIGYPLQAAQFPGFPYQVAAGSTCDRPEAGKARVHTETVLATPTYHQVMGRKCTDHDVASPCYTVTWQRKYQIEQDWDLFFW